MSDQRDQFASQPPVEPPTVTFPLQPEPPGDGYGWGRPGVARPVCLTLNGGQPVYINPAHVAAVMRSAEPGSDGYTGDLTVVSLPHAGYIVRGDVKDIAERIWLP